MRADLSVERLWIGHWPGPCVDLPPTAAARAFVVETCQRRLVIAADGSPGRIALMPPEAYSGVTAYQFMLEVTTGLKSAVPGETNVFGQFKRAWESRRRGADSREVEALAPVIARAISDTRAIRHEHLRNIGGASYGPLVRRLLRPEALDRILIVGAGELARSLLPFFRPYPLGIWNRGLPGLAFAAAGHVFAPEDGALAAGWADHVIMTTPADAGNDRRWSGWLNASGVQNVLHLGRRRGDPWAWPVHAASYDLDDVFDLRRSQDNVRSLQLERARLACRDHARRLEPPEHSPIWRFAAG